MPDFPPRRRWLCASATLLCLGLVPGPGTAQPARNDSFATAMDAAMARMDRDAVVAPTGDPDRDFAAMMIPHHQGAVEMAEAELRFGHDPILRRLAQAMIVEQRQEIEVMRQSLATLPPAMVAPHSPMKMDP
jgi:uncharacterized protein (DUF305 family)